MFLVSHGTRFSTVEELFKDLSDIFKDFKEIQDVSRIN